MKIYFYLLGKLHVVLGDEQLVVPPFRTQGLLAFLLLHPEIEYRHQIAGILFPDFSERKGRRHLSDLLYLLRKTLPQLPLESNSEKILISRAARWLDVDAFREAVVRENLADWLSALDLYRGEFLGGICDEWAIEERESLHLAYVRLAHAASARLIHQGDYTRALPILENLARQEPYDEHALRSLMRVYQALRRRGAALSIYERFVDRVANDLKIIPDNATRELANSIRNTSPSSSINLAEVPTDSTTRLEHARIALLRGERKTVEEILESLPDQGQIGREKRYLEIDLALIFSEFERAEEILNQCDSNRPEVSARLAEIYAGLKKWQQAEETVLRTVASFQEIRDTACEIRILSILANAQFNQGKRDQSFKTTERAIRIARKIGSIPNLTEVLLASARNLFLIGQFGLARVHLDEAIYLSEQNQLTFYKMQAKRIAHWIHFSVGEFGEAFENLHAALEIARNIGLWKFEVRLMNNLAELYDQIGKSQKSRRILEDAQVIIDQRGDCLQSSINLYNRAWNLLYLQDDLASQAIILAQEAAIAFHSHHQFEWEASALHIWGYALWVSGRDQEAMGILEKSYQMHVQLKEIEILPEIRAHQAIASLGINQLETALEFSQEALLSLNLGESVAEDKAADIYYAHASALQAAGNEKQSDEFLLRAYNRLVDVATQLKDDAARQALFHRSPITRRLMEQVYQRALAPHPDQIERTIMDSDHRPINIHLTLDAGPADQALKQAQGAIALRRERLKRLVNEAEIQGIRLTNHQLAEILGVCSRTVQRDRSFIFLD